MLSHIYPQIADEAHVPHGVDTASSVQETSVVAWNMGIYLGDNHSKFIKSLRKVKYTCLGHDGIEPLRSGQIVKEIKVFITQYFATFISKINSFSLLEYNDLLSTYNLL